MNTSLRRIAALVALTLIAAACSGGSGFSEDGGEGEGEGAAAQGPAEMTLMGYASSPAEDEALNAIIDSYNEQSDNTASFNPQPEYDTTLQAALASGEPPDVFYVNEQRLPDLAETGVLMPGGDRIEDADDFYPSLRDAFTFDGEFYCPPKDFSTLALQYNVDMLEEAGVEPPTTWEELATAAETLTEGDRVGLVMGAEYPRWGAFFAQSGGSVVSEDASEMTIDSPEIREAMEFLQGLHEQGFAATATEVDAGWPGEAFGQGKAAMTIEGNWMVGAMENDFPDIEWATAELPAGPDGPGTMAFTVCYAVPAQATNPDASWDLVNYLVSPEAQLEYTEQFPVMPSRESLRDDWLQAHPELEPYLAGAEYAIPFQFPPGFQDALDTLNGGIQGIAAGNRQIDQVIEDVQQAGSQALGG